MNFDLTPEEAEVFLQEADELITSLDENFVRLERDDADPALLQDIFRSAHTLKGSAGMIGHQAMAAVMHEMETTLDRLRQGQLHVTVELVDTLFAALDVVRAMVEEVRTSQSSGVEYDDVLTALRAFAEGSQGTGGREAADDHPVPPVPEDALPPDVEQAFLVFATIAQDSVAPGGRALQVLLALDQSARVLWSQPTIDDLDEEWSEHQVLALITDADPAQLEQLLSTISEVESRVMPYSPAETGESLSASLPSPESQKAPEAEGAPDAEKGSSPQKPSGDGRVASGRKPAVDGKTRWVRTSVERLDKLMNLVGELVIDRNRLFQIRARLLDGENREELLMHLGDAISHLSWITDQLQDEVMRARMVPVSQVFNKFPRLVRGLARDLGKKVELVIEGQDTELDRSVIELINDPLVHLIRNAVDHGIEPPEERVAVGKPETGRILLSARSEENHIIITVEDDGQGINPDKIRQTAVARGVLDEEAARHLSDDEALDLIFAPGFSTAKKVTELSGRGVGMDVVRTNVERLNGTVRVSSQPGAGTTFELRLPLTLAIMPALMVSVSDQIYAIPLASVMSTLKVESGQISNVLHQGVMTLRDRVLPLLWLSDFFGWENGHQADSCYVVAVRWGDAQVGIVVDGLLGQQDVVVKPLGYQIGDIPGIAGGTIMGDGTVALIVDVPGLVETTLRERKAA